MSENANLKVSIIVPVYNVEKYLEKSIASLTNQSYGNIEIILIDDGSKDASLKICNSLSHQDSRIHVIHQENQGVSIARNNATKATTGEYVMYFDSDDVISTYAVESGIKQLQKYNLDMIIGACIRIDELDAFTETETPPEKECIVYEAADYDLIRLQYFGYGDKSLSNIDGAGYIMRGPVARLVRRDIAKQVHFPEDISIGEDLIWNLNLLKVCKRVGIQKELWYGYVIHGDSAVRGYHANREEQVSKYLMRIRKENKHFFDKYMEAYLKNVAIELYCIANYEMLSKLCPMSTKEKVKFIKDITQKEPWSILYGNKNWMKVPMLHCMMLPLYKTGLWIGVLAIRNKKAR